jgi:membrane protease YdiL (CAAX protease family)
MRPADSLGETSADIRATMQPPALRIPFRHLLVIVLAQVLALVAQAWLSRVLLAQGYEELQAHYLAYLVVPPVLLVSLAPVLLEHREFLLGLFRPRRLTVPLALAAVALGVTMRIVWWAQLIARVSLGITGSDDPQAAVGPAFSWDCPPAPSLMLGLLVMAMLVPLMEETAHRGFLQSALVHRGPLPAILMSALIFTALHPPSSYWFVFFMGLVLGVQFWVTGSLWTTMITHATYNGLIQFDWRCLQGHWNPPPDSLPLLLPGVSAVLALIVSCLLAVTLLRYQRAGARTAPARSAIPARSRHAR